MRHIFRFPSSVLPDEDERSSFGFTVCLAVEAPLKAGMDDLKVWHDDDDALSSSLPFFPVLSAG